MLTILHIIAGVLDYTRHPSTLSNARGLIAERVLDRLAYYINQMNLSHENWHLEKTTIDLVEGESEYPINTAQWGKPALVNILDDAEGVYGELNIVRFQDQRTGDYSNLPNWVSVPADASRGYAHSIAFYGEGGQTKARIMPAPTVSGRLAVWFEPSTMPVSLLTDALPFLNNFANLLKVHTALICLPDCEWKGKTDEQNRAKRNDIRDSLMLEFNILSPQFEEYRLSLFQEQTSRREGFGDYDEYASYDFV